MGVYKDRVTIYEVAKAAGVSLATVSRVINNQSNVTEETKRKVEETIARLGYKPNALAQGLATNRTTNIGIVIPDVNYVHISNLLSGMIDIGKIYGYQTTLFVTKHSDQDNKDLISKLIASHVDGAVIFDDQLDETIISQLVNYNLPLVLIGNDYQIENEKVGSIYLDFANSLRKVVLAHMKKYDVKPTFVSSSSDGKLIQGLRQEVVKDLSENQFDTIDITDSYHETYFQFVEHFRKVKKGYFICQRDSLACAISNAALDVGLKVPEDVEVISAIGTKYSFIARPTISSCELDMYEVGSIAMRMITKLLKDELKEKKFTFKARFNSRLSTKE